MSLTPRQPHELNHVRLFDAGAVKSRLDELTQLSVSELATQEMKKRANQALREFRTPEPYDLPLPKLYELYGEEARKQAQNVLELERKGYVDSLNDYNKRNLTTLIRQLRFLVWSVDENGKAHKVQIITEKTMKPNYRGDWDFADVQYIDQNTQQGIERLHQIGLLQGRLTEFKDYAPYFNEEIKKLWQDATDLATLQSVRKETITEK